MRRVLRPALVSLIAFALAVLGAEFGLRFLLFSPSSLARTLGAKWRKPEFYGDPRGEDVYWKLQHLFLDPAKRRPVPGPDAACGWAGDLLQGSCDPSAHPEIAGRRPVLLYGDSYAQCTTSAAHCFPALLAHGDLADRYAMVDFGVGGYGLDQVLLLLRATIDRWKALDPIVIVSFYVEDDFQRTSLTFRCWPKPRLSIVDGKLASTGPPIAPPDAFVEANPLDVPSWLARFLVFRGRFLPEAWRARLRRPFDHREEQIALGRQILKEAHEDLDARGLSHFFLAFHGWDSLQAAPTTRWADELGARTAAELGVPIVGTRPYLLAAVHGDAALAGPRLFEMEEGRYGHYDELGNWAAFQAIRRGIEGKFDGGDPSASVAPLRALLEEPPERGTGRGTARVVDSISIGSPSRATLLGASAAAGIEGVPPAERIVLRPGEDGPTRLQIAIPENATRLRGNAGAAIAGPAATAIALAIELDGVPALSVEPPRAPDSIGLDLDLHGARELTLVASEVGARSGAGVEIAGARFEWKR